MFKRFLFSSKCGVCKKELTENEEYLCSECQKKIESKKHLRKRKNIYYLFDYNDDIRKLIINYKLEEEKNLGYFISKLIETEVKDIIRENKIDVVIPVPVSQERYLARGFNQVSFLLDIMGIDYKNITREKNTIQMHKFLDKNLRKINIKSAFKINFITKDKNILIIDDIITTGATVSEIIKSIKEIGKPKNIYVFSIGAAATFHKKTVSDF